MFLKERHLDSVVSVKKSPSKWTQSLGLLHHLYFWQQGSKVCCAWYDSQSLTDANNRSACQMFLKEREDICAREFKLFLWTSVGKKRLAVERHPFFSFSSLCGLAFRKLNIQYMKLVPIHNLVKNYSHEVTKYSRYGINTCTQKWSNTIHTKWSLLSACVLGKSLMSIYIEERYPCRCCSSHS